MWRFGSAFLCWNAGGGTGLVYMSEFWRKQGFHEEGEYFAQQCYPAWLRELGMGLSLCFSYLSGTSFPLLPQAEKEWFLHLSASIPSW